MDALPPEVIWHITTFLEPVDIVRLQQVCRRLMHLSRDGNLWRNECFEQSSFLENLRRRRELAANTSTRELLFRDLQRVLNNVPPRSPKPSEVSHDLQARANERVRIQANWDPSYQNEKIDWYTEFIHRSAPISISWLQQPRRRDTLCEPLEVRGVGTYYPPGDTNAALAVAPLDDGSVCLWDLTGSSGKKGRIMGRSQPGILSLASDPEDGNKRSKMIHTGVTECVSVNSQTQKAYIAVQSALVEVDLQTLAAVSVERYPFSISALSESQYNVPMTVGTSLSLHLHDPRMDQAHEQDAGTTKLDQRSAKAKRGFSNAFNPPETNYAPLFHPGLLSIHHLPSSGDNWNGNGDIYVAGRFPSILNYDRRYFPKLRGTIHSGARLCSLTSIPYPFAAREKELLRQGELSIEGVKIAKELPGNTLIACGEYNSKGSLEMYGLSPLPHLTNMSSDPQAGSSQSSTMKNRQTSSNSKLLSVTSHGPRLVFSDGSGNIKWVERDGFTEVRQWNISRGYAEGPRGIFGTHGDAYMYSGTGDIARKILHTSRGPSERGVNTDDLVLWTGEKIGLLSFSSKPGLTSADFEETAKTLDQIHREREERIYAQTMRRALERQADEVRFVRGLGMAFGLGG